MNGVKGQIQGGGELGSNESVCGQHNRCGEDLVFRSLFSFSTRCSAEKTSGGIRRDDVQ